MLTIVGLCYSENNALEIKFEYSLFSYILKQQRPQTTHDKFAHMRNYVTYK